MENKIDLNYFSEWKLVVDMALLARAFCAYSDYSEEAQEEMMNLHITGYLATGYWGAYGPQK